MVENNNDNNQVTYEDMQKRSAESQINVVDTVVEKDLGDKTIENVENFINTQDHKFEFSKEEVSLYKKNALLCYVPFIVFYYIIVGKYKKSNYLLFHSNQGLIVTLIWTISILLNVLSNAIFEGKDYVRNTTPTVVSIILFTCFSISLILSLFGMIHTANDKSKELPLLGNIKLLK